MLRWMPTILTTILLVPGATAPYFHGVVSRHPLPTLLAAGAWAIISHLLPSPLPWPPRN
jgi:hypothetical protein